MAEEMIGSNPEEGPTKEDFFDELERSVNSSIIDDTATTEVTQTQDDGPESATHQQVAEGSNRNVESVDWEKRYKDSTREAQKINQELSDLKPFVPVLNAMKNDSGLVDHVRDYLKNGGAPSKTITEKLNLSEDFTYDAHEAVTDPDSESAKVMKEHIDRAVGQRAEKILAQERQRSQKVQSELKKKQKEAEFKKRMNMSDEQFHDMVQKAKDHKMTLDDIHYILNRDQANKNVANATKQDMLNQMKNVRNVPTTASGANSARVDSDPENDAFESILGVDQEVDNLFGD